MTHRPVLRSTAWHHNPFYQNVSKQSPPFTGERGSESSKSLRTYDATHKHQIWIKQSRNGIFLVSSTFHILSHACHDLSPLPQFDPVTGLPKDTFRQALQCRRGDAMKESHIPVPPPPTGHQQLVHRSRRSSACPGEEEEKPASGRLERCVVLRGLQMDANHLRIVKIGSRVFWLVFCILGLAYHLQTVCDGYFRYATATDTVIDIASRFRPPALTVCFDSTSIRRKVAAVDGGNMFQPVHDCPPPPSPHESGSKADQKAYKTRDDIRDACHFPLSNMSLHEIANLTYEFGDLIQQIWYRDPQSYASILLNQSLDRQEFEFYTRTHVRTRFKGRMKCFIDRPIPSSSLAVDAVTVNASSNRTKLTGSNSRTASNSSVNRMQATGYNSLMIADAETEGMILRLYFTQMTGSDSRYEMERQRRNYPVPDIVKVFIHESDCEPRGYQSPGLILNISHYKTIIVSYQKVVNILLPPPFPSACRVYDVGHSELECHLNQKDCLEHCLDFEPGDGLLSPTTVHRTDEEKILRDADPMEVRSSCVKSCPLPCTRTEYFARLLSEKESGDGTIALGAGEAEIVVTFKARTEPFEFVIFIAGCFNLWFGVAVYGSTIDICRDMAHRLLLPPSSTATGRQRTSDTGRRGELDRNTEQCPDRPVRREDRKTGRSKISSSSSPVINVRREADGIRIPEGRRDGSNLLSTLVNASERPAPADSFLFASFFAPSTRRKITKMTKSLWTGLMRRLTVRGTSDGGRQEEQEGIAGMQ